MVQGRPEIRLNYDPKGDVLYCSFGEPREAISIESEEEGKFFRVDPETNEVVGITVVDFSKRFAAQPGNTITLPIQQKLGEALNP
jgi:uncharacterized protein YuzE